MKINHLYLFHLICLISFNLESQTTDIVVLNQSEVANLNALAKTNTEVKRFCDSIGLLADSYLNDQPRPLKKVFYEGLLETDPNRIDTRKSLKDIDKVNSFVYASYTSETDQYAQKAKEYIIDWATVYKPTGNTINENKFTPLFWAYYLFQDQFSDKQRKKVENWMIRIAKAQIDRPQTPNNNWEAKRNKIIGTVGCILNDKEMIDFSVNGLKTYIDTAYYADGTSNDLKSRDALHYHVGGLKPTIGIFVNLSKFNPGFELFQYTSPQGASISKSVAYTVPYTTGQLTHKEWVNTKVKLDKERAAAGLAEYQPGTLFDPGKAIPMFEWACYYNSEWYTLFGQDTAEENYTASWIGLLNSPLVRK